jgi:hypothetical protein
LTYLKESQVRAAAAEVMGTTVLKKSVDRVIEEARVADENRTSFDVFLSHAIRDKEIVIGTKRLLERSGRSVYVDWVVDPNLDRSKVTGQTAEKLRVRMNQCASLLYLYSSHSQSSRWMPWELGYFDGHNGNVAVLPILPDNGTLSFSQEEYLQLYPKVDMITITGAAPSFFVNKARHLETGAYKRLDEWASGTDKLRPNG